MYICGYKRLSMAYTGKKYVSRRERKTIMERNTKIVIVAAVLVIAILSIYNRVYIYDSFRFYFQ